MVRHKMVHMVRRTGAVTRAENGVFTSSAETEISTSGAAGRKNFANLVRRHFSPSLFEPTFSPKR
jgi:hypothetical protein